MMSVSSSSRCPRSCPALRSSSTLCSPSLTPLPIQLQPDPNYRRSSARLVVRLKTKTTRGLKVFAAVSGEEEKVDGPPKEPEPPAGSLKDKPLPGSGVNLMDPVATASRFITRRFGFTGALIFIAGLASVEGWEIVKAVLETEEEGAGELVQLPSGLSYREIKVGGGSNAPKNGDFVGVSLMVKEGDNVLIDTKKTGRPLAFTFGKRPFVSPICAGLEEGVATMKRGGVRELIIPPELGFGSQGKMLANGNEISSNATLAYTVTIEDITGSYL